MFNICKKSRIKLWERGVRCVFKYTVANEKSKNVANGCSVIVMCSNEKSKNAANGIVALKDKKVT